MQASTTDQATIDRITAKAMEEFFRFGIRSVSMDDISKLMGMSKKTLYKYFDNKKDLVHSVVRYKILQEVDVLDSVETQARDAIHEMVILSEHIIDHVSTIAPTVVIDLQKYYPQSWSHIQSFQREHLYKMIKSNVDRGILEGYYRNTLRPDIISKLYVSMCFII
ncbi:MAG: TetR/AcrR family transcriptional regulator, partial [Bacteroidota bacterium]